MYFNAQKQKHAEDVRRTKSNCNRLPECFGEIYLLGVFYNLQYLFYFRCLQGCHYGPPSSIVQSLHTPVNDMKMMKLITWCKKVSVLDGLQTDRVHCRKIGFYNLDIMISQLHTTVSNALLHVVDNIKYGLMILVQRFHYSNCVISYI